MQLLSKDRLGCFTASRISDLQIGVKGGRKERDKYVREKAEELVMGFSAPSFSNKSTRHGENNEYEGFNAFGVASGLIVKYGEQQYFKINENCGATPDGFVLDFDENIIATVDIKCPTSTFFEQKLLMINEGKPEYQNVPKQYFYQAQMQMMALNVNKHYLVRYLSEYFEDNNGDMVKVDMPLEQRIFWKEIERDESVCDEILDLVKSAVSERDLLIKIFKQPII